MYRVGIDLGGTNIKAGIVNDNQKILAESFAEDSVGIKPDDGEMRRME